MRVVHCVILVASLAVGGQALAAGPSASQFKCDFTGDNSELVNATSVGELREEVRSRYEHAAEVAKDNKTIYSTSPLYEWANQAKISCAKSYGALRMGRKWRNRPDYVMLQKCECFYQRMTAYLGR